MSEVILYCNIQSIELVDDCTYIPPMLVTMCIWENNIMSIVYSPKATHPRILTQDHVVIAHIHSTCLLTHKKTPQQCHICEEGQQEEWEGRGQHRNSI